MSEKYYKLFELAKGDDINKKFKARQKIANLFKKPKKEKGKNMPRVLLEGDNQVQQADLLYLPHDGPYKYALVVVDVGSRFTDAEPLKNKKSEHIVEAFKKIYKRGVIKIPKIMQTDPGTEFKGKTKEFFEKHNCGMRYGKPGRHRQQSLAESRNQIIGNILIKRMTSQELITGEYSTEWIDDLPVVIEAMNEHYPEIKPKVNNDSLPICEANTCELLEPGTKVRVILDEPHDIKGKKEHGKFRSADMRWENDITKIERIILRPQQPPMYMTEKYPHVTYTRLQLQVVSDDEEDPPTSVLRNKKVSKEKEEEENVEEEEKVEEEEEEKEVQEKPKKKPPREKKPKKQPSKKQTNTYAKKFQKPKVVDKKKDREFWKQNQ